MGHSSQQNSVNTFAHCPKVYDLTWGRNSEVNSTSFTSGTLLLLSVEMSAGRRRGSGVRGFGGRRVREWHSVIQRSYRLPVRVAQCCTAVIQTVGQSGTVLYGGHTDGRSEWRSVVQRSYRRSARVAQCCTAVIQAVGQSGTVLYGGHTDCRSEWRSVVRRSYRRSVRVAQCLRRSYRRSVRVTQCCAAVIQTVGQSGAV
jgi:hypothetical protein